MSAIYWYLNVITSQTYFFSTFLFFTWDTVIALICICLWYTRSIVQARHHSFVTTAIMSLNLTRKHLILTLIHVSGYLCISKVEIGLETNGETLSHFMYILLLTHWSFPNQTNSIEKGRPSFQNSEWAKFHHSSNNQALPIEYKCLKLRSPIIRQP